jgi:tetratricopeptide (TPR) repeat protein
MAALASARAEPAAEAARLAAMQGRKADTLAAVQQLAASRPVERVLASGGSGWELTPEYSALVRFGLWDELIALMPPDARAPGLRAGYLYGRGVALAARGRLAEARASLAELERLSDGGQPEATTGTGPLHDIVSVAAPVVAARIASSERRDEEAVARLEEAVAAEDRLPPGADWFFPVRHLLGAQLLSAGRAAEAERTYRDDLERHPGNGWSLFGLAAALRTEGRAPAAAVAEREFFAAWKRADVRLVSSAFWFPGPDATRCECERTTAGERSPVTRAAPPTSADRQPGGQLLGAQHEARVD